MNEFIKKLDCFIEEQGEKKNDLKILSFVAEELECFPDEILNHIAKKLDVFPSSLDGTIKYYPKLQKIREKNYIQVCVGRNCIKKGLKEKVDEIKGKVDLTIVERNCFGKCGRDSNISVGDRIRSYKDFDELEKIILNSK